MLCSLSALPTAAQRSAKLTDKHNSEHKISFLIDDPEGLEYTKWITMLAFGLVW